MVAEWEARGAMTGTNDLSLCLTNSGLLYKKAALIYGRHTKLFCNMFDFSLLKFGLEGVINSNIVH